jgi:deoxyribodipyrimidine photo-lyase
MHSIVWFKKDLRLSDHAPLLRAAAQARQLGGAVLPLWVYEPECWQQPDASARHLGFANECLIELEADIQAAGGHLLRCHGEMLDVLAQLHTALGSFTLFSHEETGNGWSYARDKAVARWCKQHGVAWLQSVNNAVVRKLDSRDRWSQHWNARMRTPPLESPAALAAPSPAERFGEFSVASQSSADIVPWMQQQIFQTVMQDLLCGEISPEQLGMLDADAPQRQRGGRSQVEGDLFSFLGHRGQNYRKDMSSPLTGADSCSRISPHLAWGTLSIKEAVYATWARRTQLLALAKEERPAGFLASLKSFEGRLHWHCHFIQKLESEPAIEWRNVNRGFDGIRNEAQLTQEEETKFTAWATGQTGYPFVDACMRSLQATGWINFRMRAMLVSFASYHLWLHWRATGCHLARLFTDYEPGIHWSQFQMQSGVTGINTVRIYNPIKQSHDQDPDGIFIRTWVPELAHLAPEQIHEPWLLCEPPANYPAPIVDCQAAARAAKEIIYGKKAEKAVKDLAKAVYDKHGSRHPAREGVRRRAVPRKARAAGETATDAGQQMSLEI